MFKTYSRLSSLVKTSRWYATNHLVAPVSVRLVYYMLISYYANKKSSPRLLSWQPSLIFFNTPIESRSTIKPCTLKLFQVPILAPGLIPVVVGAVPEEDGDQHRDPATKLPICTTELDDYAGLVSEVISTAAGMDSPVSCDSGTVAGTGCGCGQCTMPSAYVDTTVVHFSRQGT